MLLTNLAGRKIILASKSPRRMELLKGLEVEFEVRGTDVEEIYPPALHREEVPRYLSRLKAESLLSSLGYDDVLITADTIVYLDGKVVEKPLDEPDAERMLSELSNKKHTVITGVTVVSRGRDLTFHDESDVWFAELKPEEIRHYVERYKPLDKAGAYGVQDFIGYMGVERIEGSYFNVMGLPVHRLWKVLRDI
jgi:septum formation protein